MAQVIGAPDERLQEVPVAFIELHPDASVTEADVVAYCAGQIASYKVPRRVDLRLRVAHVCYQNTKSGFAGAALNGPSVTPLQTSGQQMTSERIIQNAYYVPDIDKGIARFHALWGLGPVFVRRHIQLENVTYARVILSARYFCGLHPVRRLDDRAGHPSTARRAFHLSGIDLRQTRLSSCGPRLWRPRCPRRRSALSDQLQNQ